MDIPPNGLRQAVNESSNSAQSGSARSASGRFWNMLVRVSDAVGQLYQYITGNTPSATSIRERELVIEQEQQEFQRVEFGDADPVRESSLEQQTIELNNIQTRGGALSPMMWDRLNELYVCLGAQKKPEHEFNLPEGGVSSTL